MADIATAYVQIVPTTKDIKSNLTTAMDDAGTSAGTSAGKKAGSTFGSGLSGALKTAGSGISAVGDKISNIGKAFTGVTVGVAAATAGSVAAWKEVDNAMDTVAIKTGATGDKLEGLQNSATNLAKTLPVSFEDAGNAIGEVNTRFGLTGDACESLSKQFIEFANLNDTDVSTSVDNVQNALTAFGLSSKDAGAMLDTLNVVGQNTGANVDTLAQEMTTYGSALQGMGLNAADAANLLGQLEMSGVDASAVMMGLSKVQQNAAKDGVSMQKEFSTALKDSTSAADVFGTRAGAKLYDAFKSGKLSADMFTQSTHSLNDSVGSVSTTFETTQDPLDQMTVSLNNLKLLGADLVNAAAPLITQITSTFIPIIQQLSEKWQSLSSGTQEMIIKTALISAAIGPVLGTIGSITHSLGALVTGISALANPIGLVVVAIGAAVAAGVLLYKNWDTIKEKAGELKDAVANKFNELKDKAVTAFDNLNTQVATDMQAAADNTTVNTSLIQSAVDGFKTDGIVGAFTFMGTNIETKMQAALDAVGIDTSGMQSVMDALKSDGILGVFDLIKVGIQTKIESARDIVGQAIDKIKSFFNFEWSLPPLKVPEVHISGKFSLSPPSVPHFSVTWHAKAMEQPYLFDHATLFGAGEAGDEIMYGRTQLMSDIKDAVSSSTTNQVTINVYGAQGQDVHELADVIQDRINAEIRRKGAAFA